MRWRSDLNGRSPIETADRYQAAVERVLFALFRLLGRLPFPAGQVCGRWIGRLWFAAHGYRRRLAIRNILRSFPEHSDLHFARSLARRCFENAGATFFEVLRLAVASPKQWSRWVEMEGAEHYQKALDRRKGLLLLTGHIGNWELLGLIIAYMLEPGGVVARPLDFEPLDRYLNGIRTSLGHRLFPKDGFLRPMVRFLKSGKAVGVLLDQNTSHTAGVFVPFFGRRACTSKGMAYLALTTGAAVVPMYDQRLPSGKHLVRFLPELKLNRTGDRTRDMEDDTSLFTHTLETIIREVPGQWMWFHDRWRQKPWTPWPRERP